MTLGAFEQMALVETYVGSDGLTTVRDSFRLTPSFGAVYYQTVDLGFPDVRSSVQDNPQADGTYDETRYLGARTIAITGTVLNNAFGDTPELSGWDPSIGWNSASWFCRYLSSWANPARRCRLYFTDDSGASRYLDIRGDSFSAPVDQTAHAYRSFQIGFVNPSGKIYSFSTDADATADGRNRQRIRQSSFDVPGRAYPEVGPYRRQYPSLVGAESVDYGGTVSNGFVANIYTSSQPMTGPRLSVTSPDGTVQTIGITGYTIPAHSVVTVDTLERTITTSDGLSLDEYKTAPLQWPQLRPGITSGRARGYNTIGFTIASGASDAYVEILWNDADLL